MIWDFHRPQSLEFTPSGVKNKKHQVSGSSDEKGKRRMTRLGRTHRKSTVPGLQQPKTTFGSIYMYMDLNI